MYISAIDQIQVHVELNFYEIAVQESVNVFFVIVTRSTLLANKGDFIARKFT